MILSITTSILKKNSLDTSIATLAIIKLEIEASKSRISCVSTVFIEVAFDAILLQSLDNGLKAKGFVEEIKRLNTLVSNVFNKYKGEKEQLENIGEKLKEYGCNYTISN